MNNFQLRIESCCLLFVELSSFQLRHLKIVFVGSRKNISQSEIMEEFGAGSEFPLPLAFRICKFIPMDLLVLVFSSIS